MVHEFPDKCAFVKANCADEEAGLISYLGFYYCTLRHVKPLAFIILIAWVGLLFSTIGIAASDFLCINLGTIASILGMSESLTGVTFLAFGNGSPDVFSTFAAMNSHSGSLAVGELIGAASFITAVVAGSMAIVRPFEVARKSFVRDVGFFVVAACFSMLFLADGQLHLWECASMVGFYLFYVLFVVGWHWWFTRQRHWKTMDVATIHQRHPSATSEVHLIDSRPQANEEGLPTEETNLLRFPSYDDLGSTEDGIRPRWSSQEVEEDGEEPDRRLANLRSNMRVTRLATGERHNTINPIRPSLVGALEFRSVLHSLEKQSSRAPPITLRRYSHEPSPLPQSPPPAGSQSQPRSPLACVPGQREHTRRARAVSVNDAMGLRLESPNLGWQHTARARNADLRISPMQSKPQDTTDVQLSPVHNSPKLLISPPESSQPSRQHSPIPAARSPEHLAPPAASLMVPQSEGSHRQGSSELVLSGLSSPSLSAPKTASGQLQSCHGSPLDNFPSYTESPSDMTPTASRAPSIRLPPPSLSSESGRNLTIVAERYSEEAAEEAATRTEELQLRRFKWWPYWWLPPPQTLGRILLPTIFAWNGKDFSDKLLGIIAVPSVLLLTITLPVVEVSGHKQEQTQNSKDNSRSRSGSFLLLSSPQGSSVAAQKQAHIDAQTIPADTNSAGQEPQPEEWHRWLICLQLLTAPLFVVAIGWLNLDVKRDFASFIWYILCSLVFSLVCLLLLLSTSSPTRRPDYRPLFCFLGFAVAIAWISTIAAEVVGVLKAFGVIFGISDAILGLTIFAVGNSLGDLVANITVAKLGFPVMALSACFGGPMLNILLGIGVSGLYIIIRHSSKHHHLHPDQPKYYHPFQINVSTTLLISGVTLLTTLVGLLIVVPLNKWRIDRKVGFGLIGLWTVSTIGNLLVEGFGWGSHIGVSRR